MQLWVLCFGQQGSESLAWDFVGRALSALFLVALGGLGENLVPSTTRGFSGGLFLREEWMSVYICVQLHRLMMKLEMLLVLSYVDCGSVEATGVFPKLNSVLQFFITLEFKTNFFIEMT